MTDLMTLLRQWVPEQRWYAAPSGGGDEVPLRLLGSYSLADPGNDRGVQFITVAILQDETPDPDGGTGARTTYQVPLVIRDVDSGVDARGYLGTYDTPDGPAAVVDGPYDGAFTRALLELVQQERTATGPGGTNDAVAYGMPMPGARAGRFRSSRVLQGEQSNTSIVVEMRDEDGETEAAPLILKVFRTLSDGDNPDVSLQTAIAAAGSLRVPPALGHVSGQWPDPRVRSGRASGHLAFAQEFLAGVEDAWRVARRAAESGDDFTDAARSLGEATAETHEVLRRVLPTVTTTPDERERAIAEMLGRLAQAVTLVPELASRRERIERVYRRAGEGTWPAMQRIHGDYHLGQVLAVPERGWVLLDFEGEPLRPLAERNVPDLAVRDLAGMLRSFDYVAGSLELQAGHAVADDWARAARTAFLAGYGADAVPDPLLAAYELDKAVYEAIYECTHRPDWLPIPVRAIDRLVEAADAPGEGPSAP